MAGAIGGSLIGGLLNRKSQKKAASQQERGLQSSERLSREALAEQQRQFDLTRGDTAQYRDIGGQGLNKLRELLLGGDPTAAMEALPGYKFRRGQGEQGVTNYMARKGMGRSGRALQALEDYGQDYASGEYGKQLGQLMQLANYGVGGVGQAAAAGGRAAAGATNILGNQASRNLASGTNLANLERSAGGAYNKLLQGGISNYMLDKYLGGKGGAGGGGVTDMQYRGPQMLNPSNYQTQASDYDIWS